MADRDAVIRLRPLHYIHVLDNNTNITRVVLGPHTFTRQEHEKILGAPEPMVMIPPRHYVIIQNPVTKVDGVAVTDRYGNYKLRHGDEEVRLEQEPFALYPGEKLLGKVAPLQVVPPDAALRLRAVRDFKDTDGTQRFAGDEWLFRGPATYIPRVEVQVAEPLKAIVIKENQALKVTATEATVDVTGVARRAGEEYLVRSQGAYIPGVHERVKETVHAIVLTEKKALHIRAQRDFIDAYKVPRKAGDEWLITLKQTDTHIPDVTETVVGEVPLTTLTNRQYCVVVEPVDPATGKNQFGTRQLRKGEASFFLQPGERLEAGIQAIFILASEEALLLRAREAFNDTLPDGKKVLRKPGDSWMIYGACDYCPPIVVEVVERRESIPLDENEGVYVRDKTTGRVRAQIGQSYMLKPNEELWEKELPPAVEAALAKERKGGAARNKTRVVSYRAPHNSAVQVYDYTTCQSRVVLGPDAVMLQPDEHYTILNLSGGKPKTPGKIQSLSLLLGPDFMTDVVLVETADHARLKLQLAYNWHFEYDSKALVAKLFQVSDFVGDACKTLASRVRGAVARASFDEFHRSSAEIIRSAVFGKDSNRFIFSANNLVITNIDIQSVEPVDQRTRDSLQKSVQQAIEITTKSQEAAARHEAERLEQEARGKLERQKILDEAEAENARTALLKLQAESAAVESTGQATAEAEAAAKAAKIEGEAAVLNATQVAEATRIRAQAELSQLIANQDAQLSFESAQSALEITKAKELSNIETRKFQELVSVLGQDTLAAIATAGAEQQAQLLQGLGLESVLITDGASPISLFNTANGLIAPNNGGQPARQRKVSEVSE